MPQHEALSFLRCHAGDDFTALIEVTDCVLQACRPKAGLKSLNPPAVGRTTPATFQWSRTRSGQPTLRSCLTVGSLAWIVLEYE